MALTLASTFCTAITGPERYASFDCTASSVPTETQLEEYCYDVAGIIVMQTERAGQRYTPPASGISDTFLARLLTNANDIGAAFKARAHMFTFNGDERSLKIMEKLAAEWAIYMGTGSVSGSSITIGSGGLIGAAVESASGSRLLVSPVSQGEVTLEDLDTSIQSMTFSRGDKD